MSAPQAKGRCYALPVGVTPSRSNATVGHWDAMMMCAFAMHAVVVGVPSHDIRHACDGLVIVTGQGVAAARTLPPTR
ncbi:hypothetical protein [Candidatus Viridilinea mediisalina]|uniref:hypothetical protein n=1 Tax=Candidatus Viridilinea mediisalina TaxID=2024553 RepID=UPI000F590A1B|nr:hypothetical protein [Candidatus Viridilinea mediisalina]